MKVEINKIIENALPSQHKQEAKSGNTKTATFEFVQWRFLS